MRTGYIKLLLAMLLVCTAVSGRAGEGGIVEGHNQHARTGNAFALKVLALHKQLIAQTEATHKTRPGGYATHPEFYTEETWYDKQQQLISRVQWERKNPQNLHSIEVFIRDDKGRVVRDYLATYLPDYRNAPTQTQVTLYQYNGDLSAFRGFDAGGDRVVEHCEGRFEGGAVEFLLDEREIYEAQTGHADIMKRAVYRACFAGLPETAGEYLTPQ